MTYFEEQAKADSFLNSFYEAYFAQKEVPDRQEMYTNVRFLASAAINCDRLGIKDLGKTMGDRLEIYVWMLQQLGYKHGHSLRRKRRPGLFDFLGGIFGGIKVE